MGVADRAILAVILAVGVGATALHATHMLNEWGKYPLISGVLVPLISSLSIIAIGVWLGWTRGDTPGIRRIGAWFVVGAAGGVVFGSPSFTFQTAHSVPLVEIRYHFVNWASSGAFAGLVIGCYDARRQERHRQLDRERAALAERERQLRDRNERLEQFASVVSHDLRNPLHVAAGRLELASDECDSDHLEAVAAAHDRMDALIDDLLTLAREGGDGHTLQPVDLSQLVRACWDHVETGEATLTTDVDRTILADRGRLQQLLENLFRNAVEHGSSRDRPTPDQPAEHDVADVTVTVGTLADGFFVEDDGPGIPADRRDAVFELGDSTRDDGTGLGLSIVDDVAAAHDWELVLTEGPSGGARFEFHGVDSPA